MASFINSFRRLKTSQKLFCVIGGVTLTGVSTVAIKKSLFKEEEKVYPRNTVILHVPGRGPYAPSLIPFAVKLETYLRMAKIPYQNEFSSTRSKKGKFPWMEYNGECVADSSLCIDYLNKKLGIDLNKYLPPADRGIAHSMQVMAEEHLYWYLLCYRWVFGNDHSLVINNFKLGKFKFWMIRKKRTNQTWAQGMGRHTEGEVTQMMKRDLKAISDFLGQKKFLMGEVPCEEDCAVFGQVCQFYFQVQGSGQENVIKDEFPNLASYCERMKTMFWPDWDQCITHGETREATK